MKANQYLTAGLTNLQRRISNCAMALCLLGAILAPTVARAASPDAEVPFTQALADARQVTNLNSGWKVYASSPRGCWLFTRMVLETWFPTG